MRQRAHSTLSTGSGSGDRACAAQPAVHIDPINSATAARLVVMVISPDLLLEQSLVAPQLEYADVVGTDAAVVKDDRSFGQMAYVRRNMCREQQRAAVLIRLTGGPGKDWRGEGVKVC